VNVASLNWWAQNNPTSVSDTFLQYGALGACTLIACWLVFLLLKRLFSSTDNQVEQLKKLLDQEVSRGDRLEEELSNLNQEVRTSMVDTMDNNSALLTQAHVAIEEQRRIVYERDREIELLRARLNQP